MSCLISIVPTEISFESLSDFVDLSSLTGDLDLSILLVRPLLFNGLVLGDLAGDLVGPGDF